MARGKNVKPIEKETIKTEEKVVQETKVVEQTPKVKKIVESKELKNDDVVIIINNTAHDLIYVNNNSGEEFTITGYGAEHEIPFKELKAMKSQQPSFIEKEWIIIADEQAVKQLGLKDYYANKVMPKMVSNLLENDFGKLKNVLIEAKPQTKESFIKIISDKIEKRQFNDLSKILDLENILGIKLIR